MQRIDTKCYEVGSSPEELEIFAQHMTDKIKIRCFIDSYIKNHEQDNVTKAGDVFSIFLNAAIDLGKVNVITYILEVGIKDHVLSQDSNDGGILTSLDITDFSPISSAMYCTSDEILKLMKKYIQNPGILKTDIPSQDYPHIKRILEIPPHGMNSDSCLEQYLDHIYTKESLKILIDEINLETVQETQKITDVEESKEKLMPTKREI